MQWSAKVFSTFTGWSKALQLLSGGIGLIGLAYGLQILMVERSRVPVCSKEVLAAVGEQSFIKDQQLTVEVGGAVVQPGVWQLAVGARVAEAIEKAGGFSQRADRDFAAKGLNLARDLKDGEKIYVPFVGEQELKTSVSQASGNSQAPSSAQSSLVSVNTASSKDLQSLPGIGETRAEDIIDNRPYVDLNELKTKAGLTDKIMTDIQNLITL